MPGWHWKKSCATSRMPTPDDTFEIPSGSPHVRTFKQRRHRTSFGDNGAIRIWHRDGPVMLDLLGADGKTINDLLEAENESNRKVTSARSGTASRSKCGIDPSTP
jgi:hypothetical protein